MRTAPIPTRQPPDPVLDRARAGDRESQSRLLRAHARLVESTLRRIVGATPDLEDLVQEVFVEVVRGLPRYRGDALFTTWLHRVVVHVACRWLRAPRRRTGAIALVADDLPSEASPIGELATRRAFERAHELLDRLTPVKRVAFLLHVALGYSTREVAALMGSSHPTAKARIWFARRELDALCREDATLGEWVATGRRAP